MLKKNRLRLGAVAATAVAACITLVAAPAFADPAPGTFGTIAGVGSDTIQDVMNGLAHDISTPVIASWDAVEPGTGATNTTIKTKSTGNTFARPNGSGAGVNALSDSIEGGTHTFNGVDVTGQVDFARSSSGPSVTGTTLTYIPFAQDAVTYAVNAGSDFPRNIPLGSSADPTNKLTLYNIYHCTKTSYTDSNLNPVTINPYLPQSGSGTAKFWATQVGITESAPPSCVKRVNQDGLAVEEHNGAALTNPGDIVPFSIAQYIAQGNHGLIQTNEGLIVTERRGNAALGSIGGQPAIRMSGNTTVMNPLFPVTRLVYNVVASTRAANSSDPVFAAFVGSTSAVCSNPATITEFGFATIPNCGVTTITGGYTQ